ncbi:MAG: acetate kinase [Leptolyngbyaceae cyanobacterium bins.349]|nr:acetate kinase [Leptolyngbyaceae cyanobacterium bins.349]
MKILVLNAGSSSQKSCLYDLTDGLPDAPPHPLWEGSIDWTAHAGTADIKVKANGTVLQEAIATPSRGEVMTHLLSTLWQGDTQVIADVNEIQVVGHRVVHGGEEYRESCRITPAVKQAIARLAVFAPIHNPVNLEGIETIETVLGADMPQVAVFDTAFHAQLPPAAYTYPGPYEWLTDGIRRYGFHGTSHQYCAERAAQLLGRNLSDLRLITCHLGNGASLAAIQNGHSIDTTMGFTPLDGLMMGTRSGAVDPSILIYLLRKQGYTVDELDQLLNKSSGLLGISGVSGDLRQILAAIAAGNERAQLAFDVYIHRLRSLIGAMMASLQGLDALIFTAGVGENSPVVRQAACAAFEFLGLKLDLEKNRDRPADQDIATPDSTVRVLVINTQEDWMIAKQCWHVMRS